MPIYITNYIYFNLFSYIMICLRRQLQTFTDLAIRERVTPKNQLVIQSSNSLLRIPPGTVVT